MWNPKLNCYVFKSLREMRRFARERRIRLRVTGLGAVDHIYAVEVEVTDVRVDANKNSI